MNIPNFKAWKAAKRTDGNIGDVTNGLMHIYDEYTDTDRTVQAITTSGMCISRIVLGRHCDVIASSGYSNGKWDTCYCAAFYYSDAKGRCVGRSSYNANAGGGLVYSYTHVGSAFSNTNNGVRLAFRTKELAQYAGKQFLNIWADFVLKGGDNEKLQTE